MGPVWLLATFLLPETVCLASSGLPGLRKPTGNTQKISFSQRRTHGPVGGIREQRGLGRPDDVAGLHKGDLLDVSIWFHAPGLSMHLRGGEVMESTVAFEDKKETR